MNCCHLLRPRFRPHHQVSTNNRWLQSPSHCDRNGHPGHRLIQRARRSDLKLTLPSASRQFAPDVDHLSSMIMA